MNVGTKSVLFGVHQFLWHPLTVGLAWHSLYRSWPKWHEWVAIFCHDLGYWGKPNIDGPEGQRHPEEGALMASKAVLFLSRSRTGLACRVLETYHLCLYHSRHYAALAEQPVSKLFAPDKLSVLFDPTWFYLLRARLSGEIKEYRRNAAKVGQGKTSNRAWLHWYKCKVLNLVAEHKYKHQ